MQTDDTLYILAHSTSYTLHLTFLDTATRQAVIDLLRIRHGDKYLLQAQDSDCPHMGGRARRQITRWDRNIYRLGMRHSGLLTAAKIKDVVGDGITRTRLIHDELLIVGVIGYGESVRILHSDREIEIYGITLQDRITLLRVLLTSSTGGKANE